MEQNKPQPWVRSDFERVNPEVLGLIQPEDHPRYIACLEELEAANINLMDAQARHIAAVTARHSLFLELSGEGTSV